MGCPAGYSAENVQEAIEQCPAMQQVEATAGRAAVEGFFEAMQAGKAIREAEEAQERTQQPEPKIPFSEQQRTNAANVKVAQDTELPADSPFPVTESVATEGVPAAASAGVEAYVADQHEIGTERPTQLPPLEQSPVGEPEPEPTLNRVGLMPDTEEEASFSEELQPYAEPNDDTGTQESPVEVWEPVPNADSVHLEIAGTVYPFGRKLESTGQSREAAASLSHEGSAKPEEAVSVEEVHELNNGTLSASKTSVSWEENVENMEAYKPYEPGTEEGGSAGEASDPEADIAGYEMRREDWQENDGELGWEQFGLTGQEAAEEVGQLEVIPHDRALEIDTGLTFCEDGTVEDGKALGEVAASEQASARTIGEEAALVIAYMQHALDEEGEPESILPSPHTMTATESEPDEVAREEVDIMLTAPEAAGVLEATKTVETDSIVDIPANLEFLEVLTPALEVMPTDITEVQEAAPEQTLEETCMQLMQVWSTYPEQLQRRDSQQICRLAYDIVHNQDIENKMGSEGSDMLADHASMEKLLVLLHVAGYHNPRHVLLAFIKHHGAESMRRLVRGLAELAREPRKEYVSDSFAASTGVPSSTTALMDLGRLAMKVCGHDTVLQQSI